MSTDRTPRPSRIPEPHPEVRLALTPDGTKPRLDGAWWPRSRDLTAELPSLIAELDHAWGRITRAMVHGSHWSRLSHDVPSGSHNVRVHWFDAAQDPDAITLASYRIGQWELLVVPPDTPPWRAARLMTAASRPGNQHSAGSLLAGQAAPPDAPRHSHYRIRTRRASSVKASPSA